MPTQAILIGLGAFLFVALTGKPYIQWLKTRSAGQTVRDEGPKSHYVKSGTPTFGGVLFSLPLLLVGIYLAFMAPASESAVSFLRSPASLALTLYILGSALIGYADDYVKVRITKKGLSAIQKTIPMFAITLLFVLYYLYLFPGGPVLLLPFVKSAVPIVGWWKLPYGIVAFLYLYYIGNSVNFTDGVDGLLSTVSLPVLLSLAFLVPRLMAPDTGGIVYMAAALMGGLLAYLIYNRHPAQIFMGDTGSLAIGALIAGAALLMGVPWILLFAGVIYWVESLTVIIQVAYFKKTGGKRIFRMTPIHHHFELGGWSENKIVLIFTLVSALGSLVGLLCLWPYLA